MKKLITLFLFTFLIHTSFISDSSSNEIKRIIIGNENAKISIRNARKDANDEIKKLDGISEDIIKDSQEEVQQLTNTFTSKIDAITSSKEEDIMKI